MSKQSDVDGSTSTAVGRSDLCVQMTRDASGVITTVDPAVVDLLGWHADQLVGSPSTSLIHPADQPGAVAAWMDMLTTKRTGIWRGRYRTSQGSWKWVETVNQFEEGEIPKIISSMSEVSPAEASLEEQFQAKEHLLSQLADALPVGIFQVDLAGHVTLTNQVFHQIVGVPPRESFADQTSTVCPDDRPVLEAAVHEAFAGNSVDGVEIRLKVPTPQAPPASTQERVCHLRLRPLTDTAGDVSGAVGCLNDVTERARLHEELVIRASTDELTSCFNRAATLALVNRTLAASRGSGCAVIFVDIDGLKAVNDRLGHGAGDQLLATAAQQIRSGLREHDSVGRLGGDEFLVVCPSVASAARALEIAKRISDNLTTSVRIGIHLVMLRASVGVAWTSGDVDSETLIARADDAMYTSKHLGTHGVTLAEDLHSERGHELHQATHTVS